MQPRSSRSSSDLRVAVSVAADSVDSHDSIMRQRRSLLGPGSAGALSCVASQGQPYRRLAMLMAAWVMPRARRREVDQSLGSSVSSPKLLALA